MLKEPIKFFYNKYEGYISPLFLLGGFIFDNFTLRRVDLWAENLVVIFYLCVALVSILFINFYHAGWFQYSFFKRGIGYFPFILQFVFGGLFSVFFIFYFRSASIGASWMFILVLATAMIGNEKMQKRYLRFGFQISIFFIALFSYFVFALPIFLGEMSVRVFLLSGVLSLFFVFAVIFFIFKIKKIKFRKSYKSLIAVFCLYLMFNAFYFGNIIPPIPLALKESGVYHNIKKTGDVYNVIYEPSDWRDPLQKTSQIFSWKPGEPIYYYSAIFAPTKISTEIFHRWSYYDEDLGYWVEKDMLGFNIAGGRDGGYRGYSIKYGLKEGRWRVSVVTKRGQVLGGEKFMVLEVDELPEFKRATK